MLGPFCSNEFEHFPAPQLFPDPPYLTIHTILYPYSLSLSLLLLTKSPKWNNQSHGVPFVLANYSLSSDLSWSVVDIPGDRLSAVEHWFSLCLPQAKLQIAPWFKEEPHVYSPPSTSVLGPHLTWICTGLVHASIDPESSYVHQWAPVGDTASLELSIKIFPTILPQKSLSPERRASVTTSH